MSPEGVRDITRLYCTSFVRRTDIGPIVAAELVAFILAIVKGHDMPLDPVGGTCALAWLEVLEEVARAPVARPEQSAQPLIAFYASTGAACIYAERINPVSDEDSRSFDLYRSAIDAASKFWGHAAETIKVQLDLLDDALRGDPRTLSTDIVQLASAADDLYILKRAMLRIHRNFIDSISCSRVLTSHSRDLGSHSYDPGSHSYDPGSHSRDPVSHSYDLISYCFRLWCVVGDTCFDTHVV